MSPSTENNYKTEQKILKKEKKNYLEAMKNSIKYKGSQKPKIDFIL